MKEGRPEINFDEALEILNIEDFKSRIWHSNSHGELFHLWDYVAFASFQGDKSYFRTWFLEVVEFAEENWKRPESVFQHIWRFLPTKNDKCGE